ncbi:MULTISPECIES: autotransporter outer membrane beta-barrel domain-containing protein, partial [Paraburkholderia]|uniref:autotransporter outer membrane beta-barrel domain-containing protein n=1 Tax=Paraburkholderia TaxID=1822464 RepID=UPI00225A02A1
TDTNVTGTNALGAFSIDAASRAANSVLLENGGTLTVNANGSATGTTVRDGGGLQVLGGGVLQGSTVVTGTGQVTGAVTGGVAGSKLYLSQGGSFTGTASQIDMDVDTPSRWTMTGDSRVGSLTLEGQIDMAAPTAPGAFVPKTLTVSGMSGGYGQITLNVALGDSASLADQVVIDGGPVGGVTYLGIRNAGGLGGQTTGDGIQVVKTINGGNTLWGTPFVLNGPVLAGAYQYTLRRGSKNDSDFFLTSQKPTLSTPSPLPGATDPVSKTGTGAESSAGNGGNPTAGGGDEAPMAADSGVPNYRAEASLYSVVPTLGLTYNNAVLDAVSDGSAMADDRGLWGKVVSQFPRSGSDEGIYGSAAKFHGSLYSLVLGKGLYTHDEGGVKQTAGAYVSFGTGNADVEHWDGSNAGDITLRGYALGGYYRQQAPSGWYMKGQAQLGWQSQDASSVNQMSLHTSGWSVAGLVEAGMRRSLTPELTFEPAVRLSAQHLQLNDTQDAASQVSFSQADSARASVGAKLARSWALDEQRSVTAWVRPSLGYEFMGVPQTVFNSGGFSTPVGSDRTGATAVLEAGVSGWVRKNVNLNLAVNYAAPLSGNTIEGVGVNVGAKILF